MARTPLFAALEKMVAQVHAEHEGAHAGFSRRTLLKGAGAVGAMAAVGTAAQVQTGASPRIAIVGGGISGLAAALALKDAGYGATIYESQNRIGGRMHSNTTSWLNGQNSEWCGEFVDTGHKTILQLVQRFGLSTVDVLQAQPTGSTDTLWLQNGYYSNTAFYNDFQPVYNTLKSQVQAIGAGTTYATLNATGKAFDAMSLYTWIDKYVPGGHGSKLGALIDSAYNQEYGLDTQLQSALNVILVLGYQVKPGKVQIYGKSDQRYSILGGNEKLPQAIAASLPSGSIQTGKRLTRITKNSDGSFTLTFASGASTSTVVADRVIMTIPFSVLRTIDYSTAGFDARKVQAITQLGYGTNSKLSMQFSSRWWNTSGPWGIGDGNIYTDMNIQNVWDSTRGRAGATGILTVFTGGTPGASYTGVTGSYNDASVAKVASYAQAALALIEKPWPGITAKWNGRATLSTPWTDPNQLGSYSCWKVGQYAAFAGYEGVRQGRCHFGGEHCSTLFQGYMEGGAEEGIRAANEILADFKAGQTV